MAATWHIAPDGSDTSGDGSIGNPYETITKAQDVASSGDTVYLRGGTYYLDTSDITYSYSAWDSVNHITKNGISYIAYQDEVPVFDFSEVKPTGRRVTAFLVEGDNCVFKGFEVVGVQVTIKLGEAGNTQSECFRIVNGNNNRFENLSMHDGMGIGWYLTDGSNNQVINCDAYNNKGLDALSNENVDGFGAHPQHTSGTGNIIMGCRAWYNADDGYDLINAKAAVVISNCWAMYNGYDYESPSTRLGNGNGFKAGGYGVSGYVYPVPVPRHAVYFSLAVGNYANGFYANHHTGGLDWISNTAIDNNGANYNMLCSTNNSSYDGDVPGYDQYMKNNLNYLGTLSNMGGTNQNDVTYNSWTLPIAAGPVDFASLNEALLMQQRQADGSLPVVDYARLAEGSDLVDAGLDVGYAFEGAAPDLGSFEYMPATNSPSSGTVEVVPAADTHVRYGTNEGNNYGTSVTLDTRQNDSAPRDYIAYIRFDLSSVPGAITNASFQVTREGGDGLVGGRFRVLGLNDLAGNTAQNWGETALSWSSLGAEIDLSIYPSPPEGQSPFNVSRVTDFEQGTDGITETVTSTDAILGGPAFSAWLENRRLNGGLATLIIDFPAIGNSTDDKSVLYHSREASSGQPRLIVTYRTTVASDYDIWILDYPEVGIHTGRLVDADNDGLDNLGEYGLGGDPANPADTGLWPTSSISASGGNWFYYTFPRRQGTGDLVYDLQQAEDLIEPDWTNAFYEVTGTGVWAGAEGFDAVTNRVSTDASAHQYLRLLIEGVVL